MFYLTSKLHDNSVNTFGFIEPPPPLHQTHTHKHTHTHIQAQELQKSPGRIGLRLESGLLLLCRKGQSKNFGYIYNKTLVVGSELIGWCSGSACRQQCWRSQVRRSSSSLFFGLFNLFFLRFFLSMNIS